MQTIISQEIPDYTFDDSKVTIKRDSSWILPLGNPTMIFFMECCPPSASSTVSFVIDGSLSESMGESMEGRP